MKIAVIKLGSRIATSGSSGGSGEALAIIKLLTLAGASVCAYTKVIDSDVENSDFEIRNIEDNYTNVDGFDALLVMNGNVNYFGGVDDPSQTLNYYIINHFNGPVYYIMCDCNLLLKQIWPSIEKKKWSSNYNKNDINIVRDDIIYISQARFVDKVISKAKKQDVKIKDIKYFPFEKFPLITFKEKEFNENPTYDILYGGTFRGGKREDDMIKFYFGYDSSYNVEMFGKIEYNNFNINKVNNLNPPKFGKPVSYGDFQDKMWDSKSTIIIGDKLYKSWGDLAQRIYEGIQTRNVVFIDSSYDFQKKVFNKSELRDFNYVTSSNDVKSRLKKLNDIDYRKHIVDLQIEDTRINTINYCLDFLNLIKGD